MEFEGQRWIERLEMRALLAAVAADLSFGKLGEAPVDGQLLVAPVAGGKILTVGVNKVKRLNGDGSIDTSFKDPGRPAVDAGMKIFLGGALQTSSQIILGGEVATSDPFDFESDTLFFQSLNLSNGHADPTFGKDGVAEIKVGSANTGFTLTNISVLNLLPSADGGMYVFVNQGGTNTSDDFSQLAFIYKLTAQGALDKTFATDGQLVILPAESSWDTSGVDPSGRIWAIYDTDDGQNDDADGQFMMHLNADGSADKTFGTNGIINLNHDLDPFYDRIAFQSNGKAIVASQTDGDEATLAAISRINTDGSLDDSFNVGLGFQNESVLNILVDSKDRIIGQTSDELFRAKPDGTLDKTFDGNGIQMLPRAVSNSSIDVDDSGNVLLGTSRRTMRFVNRAPMVLKNGVLRIDGTEGDDSLHITSKASKIKVILNGQSQTFEAASVKSFSIFAGIGNNTIESDVDLPSSIVSGAGDDSIHAGNAADSIDSAAGSDTIESGDGDDEIVFEQSGNVSTAGGDDAIIIEATGLRKTVTIDSGGGNDLVNFEEDNLSDQQFMTVMGGAGNDTINGNTASSVIHGGDGNDLITAGAGNVGEFPPQGEFRNLLYGEAGDDTIHGSKVEDYLSGGGGKDRLFGAGGNDSIIGGDGYDRIQGLAGNDTIGGQAGNDLISGGDGADVLAGGGGNDTLDGGTGSDTIHGNAGDDVISANDGVADQIFGDGGHDSASVDQLDTKTGIESLIS